MQRAAASPALAIGAQSEQATANAHERGQSVLPHNRTMAEVSYSGIRFRSVLTARWAVFFDILGIEYLHEPQSFRVGTTIYSPSFFLPALGDDHLSERDTLAPPGVFVEIRFSPPTDPELQEALAISQHTNRNVCIFHGASMTVGLEWWPIVLTVPRPCFFSQCPFCGRYGISSTTLEDGQPLAVRGNSKFRPGKRFQR